MTERKSGKQKDIGDLVDDVKDSLDVDPDDLLANLARDIAGTINGSKNPRQGVRMVEKVLSRYGVKDPGGAAKDLYKRLGL